ncbi:hypothetical protein BKA62DRAFT_707517 [Auriculariales sp. MPI-PUGE-AT-0066]|nr:hypothetical protein BKA62DRAFT_707517 [Auriculariales sp. MPI-PUGE-AT-0066]
MLAETVSKFGHLDSVILSAGIGVMGSIANCTLLDWPKQFSVNVFSLIGTLQIAIPHLRASPNTGRIVLMSSGLGVMALPGLSAYCAAKAAVNSIARSLTLEEPDLVSLSVHPGIVDTAMIRELIETGADNGVHPATLKFFTDSLAAQKGLAKHPYPAVPAEVPARVFAWLAMNAPQELSGKVSSFYDDEIQKLMKEGAKAGTEAAA